MDNTDGVIAEQPEAQANPDGRIALREVDSPILLQGIAYWRKLAGQRRCPSRNDVTARGLKALLRYTTLLRAVDDGRDYEYRIVGDAYVLAHGVSFQGKRWSEIGAISPGFHAMIKPIYDQVVRTGEPLATRGWIERSGQGSEQIYCEYVFLPLGEPGEGVDHILIFAVYVPRDPLEMVAKRR